MKTDIYSYYFKTPVGWTKITADDNSINTISTIKVETGIEQDNPANQSTVIRQCVTELEEYFAGSRTEFTFPIQQTGTDFQQKVWQELLKIPYGTTISYGELAKRMGDEKLTRAVGSANGKNKLWIVVPCHRVIGANGSLTGYAGGIECKKWLLQHEAKYTKSDYKLF